MALLIRLLLFYFCISLAECILCYQCADSSDKAGKNDCQTFVRTMNRYRQRFVEKTHLVNKYVKNCTGYKDLYELDIYCMIVEIRSGDEVRSYIRGCTDGTDFLDADASVEIDTKVNYQNRTECININGGLEACVTICGQEHGDFCNGYTNQALDLKPSLFLLLLLFMKCLF